MFKHQFENNRVYRSFCDLLYIHPSDVKEVADIPFLPIQFFKTHSGNFIIGDSYFTKKENIRGMIYIIRDPRDICVSWSKHMKSSIDDTIKFMTNANQTLYWGSEKEKIFDKEDE